MAKCLTVSYSVFPRNFLKRMERGAEAWQVETVQHNKQQDTSSCGVLVMKVLNHCDLFIWIADEIDY